MKKVISMILAVSVFPVLAFAHGSKVDMTGEGVSAALKKFKAEESAQANAFTGVKGWLDGEKIMVKVYLSGNATITYACEMMDMDNGQDETMCSKSQ